MSNSLNQTKTASTTNATAPSSNMEYKEKVIYKNRFGPNLFRISASYLFIVAVGITTFYFAKKEVDQQRQHAMIIKKEINDNKSYPNRADIIKAERAEQLKKQQN
jgi:hypothetical protein